MKLKFDSYLMIVITACFLIVGTYKNISAGDLASIPMERMDIEGQYNQSGLAIKLIEELKKDAVLSALMSGKNIYIAQSGTKIVLKGKVEDRYTIESIVNIAYNIKGVTNVNIDRVETR